MKIVVVAGAGASADQGLVLPSRVAADAYAAGGWYGRTARKKDRAAVVAHWREALGEAFASSEVAATSKVVALARELMASGHVVTVATTNVDGLIAREWPETIELHGALRPGRDDIVLDGEDVPAEVDFCRILSAADAVIVLGLSDYTESLVDWITYTPPRGCKVVWVCPEDVPDIAAKRRSVVFVRKTVSDFLASPPERRHALWQDASEVPRSIPAARAARSPCCSAVASVASPRAGKKKPACRTVILRRAALRPSPSIDRGRQAGEESSARPGDVGPDAVSTS